MRLIGFSGLRVIGLMGMVAGLTGCPGPNDGDQDGGNADLHAALDSSSLSDLAPPIDAPPPRDLAPGLPDRAGMFDLEPTPDLVSLPDLTPPPDLGAGVVAFGKFFPQRKCSGPRSLNATATDGEIISLAESISGQTPAPECIDLPGGGIELRSFNFAVPKATLNTTGVYGSNHAPAPNLGQGAVNPQLTVGPELHNLASLLGYGSYQVLASDFSNAPLVAAPMRSAIGYVDNAGKLAFSGACCGGVKFVLDIKFTP